MINRKFVDPDIIQFYQNQCKANPLSSECQHFKQKFKNDTQGINLKSKFKVIQMHMITVSTTVHLMEKIKRKFWKNMKLIQIFSDKLGKICSKFLKLHVNFMMEYSATFKFILMSIMQKRQVNIGSVLV